MKAKFISGHVTLLGGASFAALAIAGSASAQESSLTAPSASAAQTAPVDLPGSAQSEIVVTGTRIRGVAAVGSPTIPIDRTTIQDRATSSTNDILRDVPQVTNFGAGGSLVGGPQVQNSSLNNTFANSINLRGLGTTATLTLIDGHRVAPSGANAGYTDPDIIPAIALQRIEVVADGSSAIYGSDAVAGVVNLRIRDPFNGAETSGGAGLSDGMTTYKISQVVGHKWDRGGLIAIYEHSSQTGLAAGDRPDLYNDDRSAYGGAPVSNVSFPGNVSIAGKAYAIPAGQNGQNFTLSQLGAANLPNRQSVFLGTSAIPSQHRDTGLVKYDWMLTDNLKFFGYGVYSRRDFDFNLAAATSSGPGYSVPSTNPYSPCAAGKSQVNGVGATCPANGAVSVIYSWYGDLGNLVRSGHETAMDFTDGLEWRLPADWKATLAGTYGQTKNYQQATAVNNNAVNVLLQPVGATVNVSVPGIGVVAVTHPANIPSLNLFCGAPPCNDPASLAYISAVSTTVVKSRREDGTFGADGPLFSLPGGKVRLAVGGEVTHDDLFSNSTNLTSTATVSSTPIMLPTSGRRTVASAYGELYVPLVGDENRFALAQKLDLSLAVRYDHYSDFGGTVNPKFGVNWKPANWITLHGTYGTSFRAPTLGDINPYIGAAVVGAPTVAGSTLVGASNVVATTNYASLTTVGGHAGLQPETARTFSFGFEIDPPALRGLHLQLGYYNIDYKHRIDTPANNAGFPANLNASPLYDSYVIYNPTFYPTRSTVTQAQFDALLAAKLASTTPAISNPPPVSTIVALIDGTRSNSGTLNTSGLDFIAHYAWDTKVGTFKVGVSGTYVFTYKYQQVPGGSTYDYVNVFSTIGSPLRFHARGQAGWTGYGFSANAYVNYENAYSYPNGVNFPTNLLPAGVAAGSYGRISPYTTFDLALSYDTRDGGSKLFRNVAFRIFVTNLFDRSPPFVLNSINALFDPTEASQIGRTVSLQLTKRW